jgi:hypothetical protein
MDIKQQYKGAFKIDLKEKNNIEKYDILKLIKPLAENYHRGHYSIFKIETDYSLIGEQALNGFTCFSVSTNKRFEAHLNDYAFDLLPYKSINIE